MDYASDMMMDTARSMMLSGAPKLSGNQLPQDIRKAAQDFEAVFATQMLQPMFEELSTDGLFGGGHAEGIFQSLMVQEFGSLIARQGSLGIADTVSAELLRIQEAQSNPIAKNQTPDTQESGL
ncbi:MAG: rod-binding protein [Alphaproteobacteria bacterium]|nr:rod-binding protein [Alphaproteobacteria bacterium]